MVQNAIAARNAAPAPGPKRISVITPTWNTRVSWFAEAVLSVLDQSFAEWEWCIVDDASQEREFHALFPLLERTGRVKIVKLADRLGISGAMNKALKIASSEYVCFLDHDDLLAPSALEECLSVLSGGSDAVYTDEDKVDDAGKRQQPFYKPDWSPEYFRGVMYIGHLLCVRRELALKIGGFDVRFDGVQDFEFMLRYSEQTQRIGHVRSVQYHWRAAPGSVAFSQDAKGDLGELQKTAVQAHLARIGRRAIAEKGPATHTIRIVPMRLKHQRPVSIVIWAESKDLLNKCCSSIAFKSTYGNFEIIFVTREGSGERYDPKTSNRWKYVEIASDFDAAKARNLGARQAKGEFLIFMDPDIEVVTGTWIEEMLYYASQSDVGAVGGSIAYPDDTVRHAGIVLSSRGTAYRLLHRAPANSIGYFGVLCCARDVSAITTECMMLRRNIFKRIGGFDDGLSSADQGVDICVRLRRLRLRNVFTPHARFTYLGTAGNGIVSQTDTIERFDPYYNPNLDPDACDYTVKPGARTGKGGHGAPEQLCGGGTKSDTTERNDSEIRLPAK